MIPPQAKSLILQAIEKYAPTLKKFKNSNPVIMIGELKLDRIDHKILKEGQKLNARQINKDIKIQAKNKKYEKRKAAITYRSYTVQFKRKLIQKIRQLNATSNLGLSKIVRAKARQLNIHPKNIFRWFHTKEIKKKQGGRKARYPQMEERLAQFIVNNPKMKRKHILRQAKQIMEDLQIPGREYFNFSKGWYERFRERLVRRKIIPGKSSIKREFDSDSGSDSDQSQDPIKKEEYLEKVEYDVDIKMEKLDEDQSDYSDSSDEQETPRIKPRLKKENSIINADEFMIVYEEVLNIPKDEAKVCKKEENDFKKGQTKNQNFSIKTDQSYGDCFDFSNDSTTGEKKKEQVSIFASDEQD